MAEELRGFLFSGQPHGVTGTLPELSEVDYRKEVFGLSAGDYDAYLDDLILRAEKLAISFPRPLSPSSTSTPDEHGNPSADSNATLGVSHARTISTGSQASATISLASHSSNNGIGYTNKALARKRPQGLTFTQYESYVAHVTPNLGPSKFLAPQVAESTSSIFSVGTRKSYKILRDGISKLRERRNVPSTIGCCTACREDIKPKQQLQKLPCGHDYCHACLRIMINQATAEEANMPPRCCTQAIPSNVIKSILSREEQTRFLKAVRQFSTPWEARVFCSNPSCGEFIPLRSKVDPKHPFKVVCRKCRTRVCVMCKKDAHPIGQDCPNDWELDAVLKIGERSGWRRCYKCRTLVELTYGCTHMTCRCRAQFCYICGAVWDPVVGCPNFCNGDEEMERRRQEEQARIEAQAAEEAKKREAAEREEVEQLEAEERTRSCREFKMLRDEQIKEMERFRNFEQNSRLLLWTRHVQQKNILVERQSAALEKMLERHARTSANLEDRQVVAEMELRCTLEQSEKHVRVRLKHMEAYCDGLGHNPTSKMPLRIVTERDLRELGQQYNLEKNMKQLHQARINVLRDRQAKALEQLLDRQESEVERLREKNAVEVEHLESDFGDEEDLLAVTFDARQSRLETRWKLQMEVMRKELENERGKRYNLLPPLQWPRDGGVFDDSLAAVEQ